MTNECNECRNGTKAVERSHIVCCSWNAELHKRIARASRYLKFNKREAGWRATINIQVFRSMEADANEERASWEMMRLEQGLQN
jgi:hypothetical protein